MSHAPLSSSIRMLLLALSLSAVACQDPSVLAPSNNTTTPSEPDAVVADMAAGIDSGEASDEPIVDELNHGEDKEPGRVDEQGAFHGWWTAIVTEVKAPSMGAEATELEGDDQEAVNKPFVAIELTHAVGESEGSGGYVMGSASGMAGESAGFDVVQFSGDVLTLGWKVGQGEKPFELKTTKRLSETELEGTIRSEFDPEGLLYLIKLEKLPETEHDIAPDPEGATDQQGDSGD